MSGNTEVVRQKSERPKKATGTQSVQLLPLMIKSAKTAGVLLAVWSVGWMKFSVSWVIGASALYFVGKEFRKSNKMREEEAKAAEEPALARVDELPSWVYFPDIERAEWLNKMVQQMWPYIGEHVAKTLRGLESVINDKVPKYIQPFKFEDITLGDIPPRLGGVKVYIDNVKRDEIVLDAELSYLGDADINVAVNAIKAGIKDILLHGTVRIILRPLINKIPLVGGFEFCFLNPPNIDFDLTNFANALDMPILNDSLRKIIQDQVSNYVVLPNFIRVDLCSVEDISLNRKELQLPQAVIKVTLMEADDLKRADVGKIFGKGKSDPYCKISVGGVTYSTKYKESTVRPRWDETFEFTVKDIKGQEIEVNVYDHDDHANDDFIGNTYIRMEDLAKVGKMDEWIKLSNVKTGRIHVLATMYYLTADAYDVHREKDGTGSTAILFVSVDSAKDLARRISKSHSKGLVEPSPLVSLQLGHTNIKTSPKPKTTNPRWNESFHLMVAQPENEALTAQVLDSSKNDELLGNIFFKLNKLLEDEDMILDRPFALEGTASNCTLTMRLCLRFLTTTKPQAEEKQSEREVSSSHEGGMVSEIPPASQNETETKPRYRGRQATVDESKHGKIKLTLRYNQEKEKLIVTVHKCMNLVAYDKDQYSDPYVRMYLLPDRTDKSKKKTEIMKNNLDPVWEESYEWPLKKDDISLRTLEVMVKNFIGVFEKKTKTEMGVVHLRLVDFDNLSQPVSDWFDLQDPESLLSETTSFFSQ